MIEVSVSGDLDNVLVALCDLWRSRMILVMAGRYIDDKDKEYERKEGDVIEFHDRFRFRGLSPLTLQ